MTIESLYIISHPVIDILGTLCLLALMAGGVLYVGMWVLSRIWRYLLTAGAITAILTILGLVLDIL